MSLTSYFHLPKFKFTLAGQTLLGLILGAIFGLTLGDYVSYIDFIGDAFVRMLQITVLPYIVVSLISSVGSLSMEQAKKLARNGAFLIAIFWLLGMVLLFTMPLAFPALEKAFFYSIIEYGATPSEPIIDQYIPTNVFRALADSVIPAVVLFCLFLGGSIIAIPNKKVILAPLDAMAKAIGNITNIVLAFAPLGIFGLTATAVGEMDFSRMDTLGVYIAVFIAAALIMTYVLMPAMVCSFTSFTYRQILFFSKDALLLAFGTGSTFVALTVIEQKAKDIFTAQNSMDQEGKSTINGVLPVIYNLPSLGNILPIVFILFVAWFYKTPLDFGQNIDLAFSGLLSLCGSDKNAVPFLLRELKLPGDAFDLYLMSNMILRKFMVMTTAMFLFSVCVISAAQSMGRGQFILRRAVIGAGVTVICTALVILGLKFGLERLVAGTYRGGEIVSSMHLSHKVPVTVYSGPPGPEAAAAPSVLARIKARGSLRVAYNPSLMPFCYKNKFGDIVGYDIANAHALASDLGCSLELIPLNYDQMAEDLKAGAYDVVMSKLPIMSNRLKELLYSSPYLTLHSAFVVRDDRIEDFRNIEKVRAMEGLRIGVFRGNQHFARIRAAFPKATIIVLPDHESFFSENKADAMLTTAEEGSTWTLLHPAYGVAISKMPVYSETVAYAVPLGDLEFVKILNDWLTLNSDSGRAKAEYDFWVLGKVPNEKKRHWSHLTKMLHWDYRFAR